MLLRLRGAGAHDTRLQVNMQAVICRFPEFIHRKIFFKFSRLRRVWVVFHSTAGA